MDFQFARLKTFLKWGRTLHCENNEEAKQHWPSSWEDVQSLLGEFGFKMPKLYYICLDSSHPCQYALRGPKRMFVHIVESKGRFHTITLVLKTK